MVFVPPPIESVGATDMTRTPKKKKKKLLGSIFRRAFARGKVTNLVTVVVALMLAMVTPALAATGGNFILGTANTATNPSGKATGITQLKATIANPAMKLINTSASAGATALNLTTASNKPPMTVNSATKVDNLNADTVDGRNAPLWAHVNSDGALVRGDGVDFSGRFSTGFYLVNFNRDVAFCGYVATTTDGYAGTTGTVQGAAHGYPGEVWVYTVDSTAARVDLPFHLVVTC
jgi:hypothetical protein